jgi:glycosyltransferase involved in cell wall biosynthesis
MRVLQILPNLIMGGVEKATLDHASMLLSHFENEKTFIASNGGSLLDSFWSTLSMDDKKRLIHINMPLHSKNPITMWNNGSDLMDVIDAYKIDIVHVRSRAPAWSVYKACSKTNTPWVSTYHGVYGHHNKFKRFYNSVMLKSHRVIVPSPYLKNHLETIYGYHHAECIGEGIDLSYFQLKNKVEKQPAILIPARFTPIKGHTVFMDALLKIDPMYQAIFLGQGDYMNTLKMECHKRGLDNRIHFINETADLPGLYAECVLTVLPTLKPEAFGRVVVESLAMGTPVVTSNHGGAASIIKSITNNDDYLFIPNDSNSLAHHINQTLHQDNAEFLKHAHQWVMDNACLQKSFLKTIALYESLITPR